MLLLIILIVLMFFLPLAANFYLTMIFDRYTRIKSFRGLTAELAARQILDSYGLGYVMVLQAPDKHGDCFVPKENIVYLSEKVYGKSTISAIGVAAHECGHAVQHSEEYAPMLIRDSIVPVFNFCSRFWYLVFLVGCLVIESIPQILPISVVMFAAVVLFQILTLPTEIDASHRAMVAMEELELLESYELPKAKKVLFAAAMTYITALVSSILMLLRLFLRVRSSD